jgi:hypothetical protein
MSPLQWTMVLIWFGVAIAALAFMLGRLIEQLDAWLQRRSPVRDHTIITRRETLDYCPHCFGWFGENDKHPNEH